MKRSDQIQVPFWPHDVANLQARNREMAQIDGAGGFGVNKKLTLSVGYGNR
jgi:hypothetical protein